MTESFGNQVFSQAATQQWQAWIFAIIWNAMVWFAIVMGGENILKAFEEQPIFYFFVTFPFIGLWLVIHAIRETRAWYKYGKTPVILDPFPGQVGGQVAGYIDLPLGADEIERATVSLTCTHRYYQTEGAGDSAWKTEQLWQDRVSIEPKNFGSTSRIAFLFMPPDYLPASEDQSDNYHFWQLHLRAPTSGIDFDRIFMIPMEVADEQAIAKNARYKIKSPPTIAHQNTEIGDIPKIEKSTSGTQFYYGYGRSKGMASALILFGLFIAVFAYFFFDGFLGFLPATTGLMIAYVGGIALLLVLAGVFLIANSLTVEVSLMGVRKQQRIFGFLLEEVIDAEIIVDIVTKQNASSTSGNTTRVWYKLNVLTQDGKKIEVGDSLEGQSYADEIRQQMISLLGMTWRPAVLNNTQEKAKRPIPTWLRVIGKLLSYSFLIAFIYDMSLMFPEISDFLTKVLP